MLLNRSPNLGFDPTLVAVGAQVALPIVKGLVNAVFGDDDAAKAAQMQALMLAQAQAKAAETQRWLIAGGAIALAAILVVTMRR